MGTKSERPTRVTCLKCSELVLLHDGCDVVRGLEELEQAVLELLLLISGELGGAVALLDSSVSAEREDLSHHLSLLLHC